MPYILLFYCITRDGIEQVRLSDEKGGTIEVGAFGALVAIAANDSISTTEIKKLEDSIRANADRLYKEHVGKDGSAVYLLAQDIVYLVAKLSPQAVVATMFSTGPKEPKPQPLMENFNGDYLEV